MQASKLSPGQLKVAATGFLSLFSIVGIMFYGLPFFYDFWVKEFGWSRATVTSGNAFAKVAVGLLGFFAGWLIDRFGPRRLMLTGILLGGIALIGLSTVTTLGQFYLFYVFNALAYMCAGPLPNQVLTARWFYKSRGKAMGFAYLGIGVGGMLVPQIAKWLNVDVIGDIFGSYCFSNGMDGKRKSGSSSYTGFFRKTKNSAQENSKRLAILSPGDW
jgi:MFS family permease